MKKKVLSSFVIASTFLVGCGTNTGVSEVNGAVQENMDSEEQTVLKLKLEKIVELFEKSGEVSVNEIENIIYKSEDELQLIEKLDVEGNIVYTDNNKKDKLVFVRTIEDKVARVEYISKDGDIELTYEYRLSVPRYGVLKSYNDGKTLKNQIENIAKSKMEKDFLLIAESISESTKISDIEALTGHKYSDSDIYKVNGEVDTENGVKVTEVTSYSRSEEGEGMLIQVVDGKIAYISYSDAPEDVESLQDVRHYECSLDGNEKYRYRVSMSITSLEKQPMILSQLQEAK